MIQILHIDTHPQIFSNIYGCEEEEVIEVEAINMVLA